MLGRITLNPIKHIDPVGTILMPLIALVTGFPTLGWAKPTPVNPNNFRNPVGDDILTSVVGPVSNFVIAIGALILLAMISATSPLGRQIVIGRQIGFGGAVPDSVLVPLILFLYQLMSINIVLGIFNLIPVPPLDGSHVLRHFLSDSARRAYDTVGWLGLLVLVYFGGGLLGRLIYPVIRLFNSILTR